MPVFFTRDAMHKRGYCRHAVSVCLSVRPSVRPFVCLSRSWIMSKRINIQGGDIPTGTPLTGRRMQVGYRQKSRFWLQSWGASAPVSHSG